MFPCVCVCVSVCMLCVHVYVCVSVCVSMCVCVSSELFEISHIRTIYHVFIAAMFLFIFSTLAVDFIDQGRCVCVCECVCIWAIL